MTEYTTEPVSHNELRPIHHPAYSWESFERTFRHMFDVMRENLEDKGAEYAEDKTESRYHNFECAAGLNNVSREEALWGMLTKHLVSLSDMVKGDTTRHSPDKWDEKVGDALTYLMLLRGMVDDTRDRRDLGDPLDVLRKKLA